MVEGHLDIHRGFALASTRGFVRRTGWGVAPLARAHLQTTGSTQPARAPAHALHWCGAGVWATEALACWANDGGLWRTHAGLARRLLADTRAMVGAWRAWHSPFRFRGAPLVGMHAHLLHLLAAADYYVGVGVHCPMVVERLGTAVFQVGPERSCVSVSASEGLLVRFRNGLCMSTP